MLTLTELFGEPGVGKSHAAHQGWPDPLHIDTAPTQMGFRTLDIQDEGGPGETWPVVAKLADWDEQQAQSQYEYAPSYQAVVGAIEQSDHKTIVLDNSADLRALAAHEYCQQNNTDWPQKQEWGEVNDMVDDVIQAAQLDHHVVVVSQLSEEYIQGESTGNMTWDGPKRLPYKCDWRIEVAIEDGTRHSYIRKNRFLDRAGDGWVNDLGNGMSLQELYLVSQLPESVQEL